MVHFSTTLTRSALATAVGLFACAATFVAIATYFDWSTGAINMDWLLRHGITSALITATVQDALIVVVVGLLLWLPIHFATNRDWRLAVLFGTTLFFPRWFAPRVAQNDGWGSAAWESVGVALFGAALAGIMWRLAYQTTKSSS